MKLIRNYIALIFKGMGIGIANVIPGVSGGTIALLTGIFEKLINSIKSFDLKALRLLFSGKFKEFAKHVNLDFLIAVFAGVAISILVSALFLKKWFCTHPVLVWAFFFGLVLASVYYVGRTISKWSPGVIITFLIGAAVAVYISFFLDPAQEQIATYYLMICGVVAVCSMIIPGLSGSFVLILLGNYQLIMIDAVNDLNFGILLPVIIGAAIGLILFSHFLSWVYKKYRNETTSILTGFILGSLSVIWPWKVVVDAISHNEIQVNAFGALPDCAVKTYYQKLLIPTDTTEIIYAAGLALLGIMAIVVLEKMVKLQQD